MARLRVGLCACESSGDQLGAKLIESMRVTDPTIEFIGITGEKMLRAGCESIAHIDQLSVMGFVEVLGRIASIWRLQQKVIDFFLSNPPDVFIGIDGPDFNFSIEKKLRRSGIPAVHYVSPSVWAWRKYRIRKIARSVDLMLTLFPFETALYEAEGIPVKYTGHPLLSNHDEPTTDARCPSLDEKYQWIALLPGSRKSEVKRLLPLFLEAASQCKQVNKSLKFVVPVADTLDRRWVEAMVKQISGLPVLFVSGVHTRQILARVGVAVIASGTATLECLLAKTPMIVAYILNPVTYQIVRRMMNVESISLPNHLNREKIVPEYIQADATPEKIASAVMALLEDKQARELQTDAFLRIVRELENAPNKVDASTAVFQLITETKRKNTNYAG
ncbi:MAG: lipid-A-disaccharide synthase [Gammaproteobacteria bacterium]